MFQFSDILASLDFDLLVDRVTSTFILYSAAVFTQVFIGYISVKHKKKLDLLNMAMIMISLLHRLIGLGNLWERSGLISFNFGFLMVGLLMFLYIQNHLEII